jgi:hypothetical protein
LYIKYFQLVNRSFLLIVIFLFGFRSFLFTQEESPGTDLQRIEAEEILPYLQPGKLRMNMEFGSMFSYSKTFGSGVGTYIAPGIVYPVGKRFSVHSGLRYNTFYQGFAGDNYDVALPGSFSAMIYGGGTYRLSDRVTFSGTAFKEMNNYTHGQINPLFQSRDYKGLLMGVDLKFGENFFIQGQIEVSDGAKPYWLHQGNQSGFPQSRPFRRSEF